MLLRVRDKTRQGALRFREDGVFLSEKGKSAGIKDLSQLARAAQIFAETGEVDEEDSLLIGAGSSPGGAHPKAWVQDDDGVMWLAKFPMSSDLWNVQLWEMVAINLQRQCGIRVQESRLLSLTSWSQIFLTRRFDRDGQRRIPYMSVRTALQLDPHAHPSYALLAREIAAISSQPMLDANEMFSRAAFNAMTANTDDHMRNHGLLRTAKGWSLSPAFDVNPNPTVVSAVPLVPGGDVYDRNVLELLDRCEDFRLDRSAAVRRLKQVAEAVSHWRREALALGAEPDSLESKVRAFEGPNLGRVSALPEPTDARGAGDAARRPRLTGRIWVPDHVRGGKPVRGHYRNERQPRTR